MSSIPVHYDDHNRMQYLLELLPIKRLEREDAKELKQLLLKQSQKLHWIQEIENQY